jgi:hypothetical protein
MDIHRATSRKTPTRSAIDSGAIAPAASSTLASRAASSNASAKVFIWSMTGSGFAMVAHLNGS